MNRFKTVLVAAAALGVASTGGAVAAGQITSRDIANDTIRSVDLKDGHAVGLSDLQPEVANNTFAGAIYRVENYQNGGGGSATVACADDEATSQKYTAIAGGVQGGDVNTQGDGFLVNSSFPGRMDWTTGQPKPGRLDGWIVLGNGQHTDTLKVWALCVPTSSIPVQQVDLNN